MVARQRKTSLLIAIGILATLLRSMSCGLGMAKLAVSRVGFPDAQYHEMHQDVKRTSAYYHAIDALVPGKVVLDLGTGALALLALRCARAGAAHVYAVEAAPAVADKAREAVEEAGLADRITVLTGVSQELELPSRVEVVVHELLGEIASREGVAHAIRDAAVRHVCKASQIIGNWSLPRRAITWITPVQVPDRAFFDSNPANREAVIEAARDNFEDPLFLRDFPVAACALASPAIFEDLSFGGLEAPVDFSAAATSGKNESSTLQRQVRVHRFVVQRAGYLAGFSFHITADCGGNSAIISSAEPGSHWANGLILVHTQSAVQSKHALEFQDELDRLLVASRQVVVQPGDAIELRIEVDLREVSPLYMLSATLKSATSDSVETLLDCFFG